jgi:hypothetical protein
MTNPIYLSTAPFIITEPGDYVFTNLRAGYPYTLWVSGPFENLTVQPKWVDSSEI